MYIYLPKGNNMTHANKSDLISVGQAAERLGIAINTLRRWTKAGVISAARTVGKHRRYYRADVDALLANNRDGLVE